MWSIDIWLSFKTTIKSWQSCPAWLKPSKASPPVKAPSPITAITFPFWFDNFLAVNKPRAEEIEVDEDEDLLDDMSYDDFDYSNDDNDDYEM